MPNIERERVRGMLSELPQEQHETLLSRLKERGFTVVDAPVGGPSALVPGMTQEDVDLAGTSAQNLAKRAAGEALETEIPGMVKAKAAADTGAEIMGRGFAELGVPRIGKAFEMGGKFVAGMLPVRMKDALFIAAAGPALEGAAMLGRPIAKAGGNLLADVAGAIAGKNPEVIKAMYKSPGAIWSKATEVFGLKHQEKLVQEVKRGLEARGAQFKQLEESLSHATQTMSGKPISVDVAPVAKEVTKDMVWGGHKLPKSLTGVKSPASKVGRISEKSSEAKAIFEKLEFIKKNPNLPFQDALNLRRQIDDVINYGVQGSSGLQPLSGEGTRVLKMVREQLNVRIKKSVPKDLLPAWEKANKAYSEAVGAYADLRRNVIGTTPRQTERKLLQMLQEGRYDDEVLSRVERLNETAGKALDDVRDHVAAREFRQWAVAGMRGGLPFGLPTSPRMIGMGVSAAGAAGRAAGAAVTPGVPAAGTAKILELMRE